MLAIRINRPRKTSQAKTSQAKSPELVCHDCGKAIRADAAFCAACRAPIVRRYCPRCSKLVPEFTQSCPYCGASATAPARLIPSFPVVPVSLLGGAVLVIFLMTGSLEHSRDPQNASAGVTTQKQQEYNPPAFSVAGLQKNTATSQSKGAGLPQNGINSQLPTVRSDEASRR